MKMKKILSVVLSLAMAAMLSITAYAEEPTEGFDMKTAGISKILKVADGVDIDGIDEFTFSVAPTDGNTVAAKNSTVTIKVTDRANGLAVGSVTFDEIFGDVSNYDHAGEYAYNVTETTTGFSSSTADADEKLTVDDSTYKVRLLVANKPDGTGLTYKEVFVEENGEKIDPTITERVYTEDPNNTKTIKVSEAEFVNTYTKLVKGTKESPVLRVKKSITGEYSDKTLTFQVQVIFTIPETAEQTDVEVAPIAGKKVSINWPDGPTGKLGRFSAPLTDGEALEFTKIPAGTTFKVTEEQDGSYQSKITGFVVKADSEYVSGDRDVEGKGPILEKLNEVFIENTKKDGGVPTGLVINNWPYIAVVAAAVAGLAFLVIKKAARKD